MEFQKELFHGMLDKERKQVQITIAKDCNVPDTKPDIEKMIQTKGEIVLQETELMVDQLRITGELHFAGLYQTIDPRTYLESTEFSLPFEERIHMEGALPTDYAKISYVIDDINTVLINSRKLSIRILLTLMIQLNEEKKEEGIVAIEEEGVSSLKKKIEITDLVVNKKDIARIKEELELPTNKSNIYQLLWYQVDLENVQVKLSDHQIQVDGDMNVFILYLGEDEQMPIQYARWEFPIQSSIECYECAAGMIGSNQVSLGMISVDIRPDLDGEERIVSLEAVLDCNMKLYEDRTLTYVDDAYTMEKNLIPQYKNIVFETLIGKNQATMRLEKQFSLENMAGNMLQVLAVKGSYSIDEMEKKTDGIQIEGALIADVLFLSTQDQMPVVSETYVEPFSYFIEAKGISPESSDQIDVRLDQLRVTQIEGEKIELKTNLVFDFISFEKKEERIMIDMIEEPIDYDALQKMPGIVGYLVKDGDTLWSVAKRYYTTVESIQEQNEGIEEIKAGDKLLIVKEI